MNSEAPKILPEKPATVDAENPWPGLAPFTEDQRAYFHGRSKDSAELLQLVKRESLTIVYGRSGLGKSSLLQAGLFPLLREVDGLPIYIRLAFSAQAPPLAQQVFDAVTAGSTAAGVEFAKPRPGQSLWEYFQHSHSDFWTAQNRPATPVLVLDQFEEIFTLGRADDATRQRVQEFLTQLGDLVENRVPENLKARFAAGELKTGDFEFDEQRSKVVLSLREDYVPELGSLRPVMRSIDVLSNWKRLLPMSGTDALEAVLQPGASLVDPDVARLIVKFVAKGSTATTDQTPLPAAKRDALADLEVEPALLSVVCFELNKKRQARNLPKLTANLLDESSTEILQGFYEQSVKDLPPNVRDYIEDQLLTESGHRDSVHVDDALLVPGLTPSVLEKLIGRRLIRLDNRLGATRVELTHDRLADPVRASREKRRAKLRVAEEQAAGLAKRRRRVQKVFAVLSLLCVILGIVAARGWFVSVRQAEQAQEDAKQLAAQKADIESQKGRIEKLIPKYFLRQIKTEIDQGNGPGFLLHWRDMAGGGLPYTDTIAPLIPQSAYAADALIRLSAPAAQIVFTGRGSHLAVLNQDGSVAIFNQSGSQNQWATISSVPSAGSGEVFVYMVADPTNPDAIALRTSNQRILFWDCRQAKESSPSKEIAFGQPSRERLPFVLDSNGKPRAAHASGALYAEEGDIRVHNGTSFPQPGQFRRPDREVINVGIPRQLLLIDGDQSIVTVSDTGVWLWKAMMSPTRLGPANAIAAKPDGSTLVLGQPDSADLDRENSFESVSIPVRTVDMRGKGVLAYSPDGRRMLVASQNQLRVVEFLEGFIFVGNDAEQVWSVTERANEVTAAAFRSDGQSFAATLSSGPSENWLKVWRQTPQAELGTGNDNKPLAASPDGRWRVERRADNTVHVLEKDQHRVQLEIPKPDSWDLTVRDIAIDDRGRVVGITSVPKDLTGWFVEEIRIWEWQPGQVKAKELAASVKLDHTYVVRLSQDGRYVTAASSFKGQAVVALFDVNKPEPLAVHPLLAQGKSQEFALVASRTIPGKGDLALVARADGQVCVFPTSNWMDGDVTVVQHEDDSLIDAAIVPGTDQPRILTVGPTSVFLWETVTGAEKWHESYEGNDFIAASVSNDAKLVAIATEETVEIHKTDPGEQDPIDVDVSDLGTVHDVALSGNGQMLAIATRRGAWVYSVDPLKQLYRLTAEGAQQADADLGGNVRANASRVRFSPDRPMLAVTWEGGGVNLFDTEGKLTTARLRSNPRIGVSFTPDGAQLITVDGNQMRLIDSRTGVEMSSVQADMSVHSAAAMSVGDKIHVLCGFASGTWQVRDATTSQVVARSGPVTLSFREKAPVLAVSKEGKVAVAIHEQDRIHLLEPPAAGTSSSSGRAGQIQIQYPVSAMSFTPAGDGLVCIRGGPRDTINIGLVDLQGEEILSRTLPRSAERIIGNSGWMALTNEDDPYFQLLRWRDKSLADCIREMGMSYDEGTLTWNPLAYDEHARRLAASAAAPLDIPAADFHAAWWKTQIARGRLTRNSGEITRTMLEEAYAPLAAYAQAHPSAQRQYLNEAKDALAAIAPPQQGMSAEVFDKRLSSVLSLPNAERLTLLNELSPLASTDELRGQVHYQLARAYAPQLPASKARTLENVIASDARGFVPFNTELEQFQQLWSEATFPVKWLSVDELNDRALEVMKDNTAAANQRALALLDIACDKNEMAYAPWLHRSIVLGRLERHEDAVDNYRTMLAKQTQMDTDDKVRVLANLGFRYGQWGRSHYNEAFDALAEAIKLDPRYSTAYRFRIDLFIDQKRYDAALEDSQKLSNSMPDTRITRGKILLGLGRWDEAKTELAAAVELEPTEPLRWSERGDALIDGKNRALLPMAVDSLTTAIQLTMAKPANERTRLNYFYERRGVALRRLQRWDEALADFNKMLETDPRDAFAMAETGAIAASQGKSDVAIDRLRKSLDINAKDSWAMNQLAKAYVRRVPPDLAAAVAVMDKAVEQTRGWLPERAELHRRAGGASMALAEKDLREAVDGNIYPLQSNTAFGELLLMTNRADEARKHFQQALEVTQWVGEEDLRTRAMAHAYLGQFDQAQVELGLRAGREPADPDACYISAQINALRSAVEGSANNASASVALHDLIMYARWGDADWSNLVYSHALKSLAGETTFKDIVTALQKPVDEPQHDIMLARAAVDVANRLSRHPGLAPEYRAACIEAAQFFALSARQHGAADADIQQLQLPATRPATQPVSSPQDNPLFQ